MTVMWTPERHGAAGWEGKVMARDKGVDAGYRGIHRAGKHTQAGQAAAKSRPRLPKGSAANASDTGIIYTGDKPKGLLGRLFG